MEQTLREPELIVKQMLTVRKNIANMDTWTLSDISADILTLTYAITDNIEKADSAEHGNIVAKFRIRKYLLALETLGRKFRSISI